MIREPYEPDRARQLRILVMVVAAIAVALAGFGAFLVTDPGRVVDEGQVSVVLLLPGVLLGTLSAWSLVALARVSVVARVSVPATAAVAVLVGLMLSRTGPGMLIGLVGILLLLMSVLPGRDPADRAPR
ncbi:hypothetical protein [Nocardioides sp.]|uniref:hypothetical protein n=1 Tax=Nocardioides sp. TaxID=35761 RepID=UPI003562DC50